MTAGRDAVLLLPPHERIQYDWASFDASVVCFFHFDVPQPEPDWPAAKT